MVSRIVYALAGALVVFLVGLLWLSGQEPEVYREIVVKEIRGEPDTIRTFVDRVVYREVEPEIIIREPEGGRETQEAFCEPDTVIQIIEGDTVWLPQDTVFLVRSVDHRPGWFLQKDQVILFGPTSIGDLSEVRFKAYPGWSVRTHPEMIIREPRIGIFREILEAGVYGLAGYALGKAF